MKGAYCGRTDPTPARGLLGGSRLRLWEEDVTDPNRFERRWANRRATGSPRVAPLPQTELPTAGMQLLSDYEDAIFASARHNVIPANTRGWDENAHMVEAARLQADVRRLRMEVHALMESHVDGGSGEAER